MIVNFEPTATATATATSSSTSTSSSSLVENSRSSGSSYACSNPNRQVQAVRARSSFNQFTTVDADPPSVCRSPDYMMFPSRQEKRGGCWLQEDGQVSCVQLQSSYWDVTIMDWGICTR